MPSKDLKKDVTTSLSSLLSSLTVEPDNFNELLVFNHGKQLVLALESSLNSENEVALKKCLVKLLKDNWEKYRNTALCYTANPNAPATKFMCELAALLSDQNTSAFTLLMPDVSAEPIVKRYPNLNEASSADDLVRLLNEHIIGRDGLYLIPVALLYKEDLSNPNNLPNFYFDVFQYQDVVDCKINREELDRLKYHSAMTQQLFESLARYQRLAHDDENLLGQLNNLIRHLTIDSVNGIGSEELSGTTFALASQSFFLFFEKLSESQISTLPESLKYEISLIKDYMSGIRKYDIGSCFATRANTLQIAVRGNEELLNGITLSDKAKEDIFKESKKTFDAAKVSLKVALENPDRQEGFRYSGQDRLPVTQTLLEETGTSLIFKAYDNVTTLINTLSVEDIPVLFNNDSTRHSFFTTINTFELACDFILNVSTPALSALLNIENQDELVTLLLSEEESFLIFLGMLDEEKKTVIIQGLFTHLFNHKILELLIICLKEPTLLRLMLHIIAENGRLSSVLRESDKNGYRLFHKAYYYPESLKVIFDSLPEDECISFIKEKNQVGETLLFSHTPISKSAEMILKLIPENDRLDFVRAKKNINKRESVLHVFHYLPTYFKTILESLPEEHRLLALMETDAFGCTVLHKCAEIEGTLQVIFNLLPKDKHLFAIDKRDIYNETLLNHAAHYPKSLKFILDLYPEEKILSAITNNMVLHSAASNLESLKIILELYPENQQLLVAKRTRDFGNTLLHCAALQPECLKTVLDLYPVEERLFAIEKQNHNSRTVLHEAVDNPSSVKFILDQYPLDELLGALLKKDRYSNTVLDYALRDSRSFEVIFNRLPEAQHLEAFKENGRYSSQVMYWAPFYPESLKQILALLPADQRLDIINEKSHHGRSLLDRSINKTEALKAILLSLKQQERFLLLKSTSKKQKLHELHEFLRRLDVPKLRKCSVMMICKHIVLHGNNTNRLQIWHNSKWPNLAKFLRNCDSYESFYLRTYELLLKNHDAVSTSLLDLLGVRGEREAYENRLQVLAQRWGQFGVTYRESVNEHHSCSIM